MLSDVKSSAEHDSPSRIFLKVEKNSENPKKQRELELLVAQFAPGQILFSTSQKLRKNFYFKMP